jgi:hypothetical protein
MYSRAHGCQDQGLAQPSGPSTNGPQRSALACWRTQGHRRGCAGLLFCCVHSQMRTGMPASLCAGSWKGVALHPPGSTGFATQCRKSLFLGREFAVSPYSSVGKLNCVAKPGQPPATHPAVSSRAGRGAQRQGTSGPLTSLPRAWFHPARARGTPSGNLLYHHPCFPAHRTGHKGRAQGQHGG